MVTGGGSGIGEGIVMCMAREGADVAIPDILEGTAERVAREAQKLGRRALGMRCDVTRSSDVHAALDRIRRRWGRSTSS